MQGAYGLLFLIYPAISDYRKKSFDLRWFALVWAWAALCKVIARSYTEELTALGLSLLPGMIFLAISLLLPDELGIGDGLAILGYGLLEGFEATMMILLFTLGMLSLTGLCLMLLGKADRKTKLPLVTFLLPAAAVWVIMTRADGCL